MRPHRWASLVMLVVITALAILAVAGKSLLSGLLIPMAFFPDRLQKVLAWLPFEHIAYTPLQIYLGKLDHPTTLRMLGIQWFWVVALLVLAHLWWSRASEKITIHGG